MNKLQSSCLTEITIDEVKLLARSLANKETEEDESYNLLQSFSSKQ